MKLYICEPLKPNIYSMQNNGLIKLFGFLFGIVSIYQLSFTFISSNQEAKAKTYAEQKISASENDYLAIREQVAAEYLDSIETNRCMVLPLTTMPKGKNSTKDWI